MGILASPHALDNVRSPLSVLSPCPELLGFGADEWGPWSAPVLWPCLPHPGKPGSGMGTIRRWYGVTRPAPLPPNNPPFIPVPAGAGWGRGGHPLSARRRGGWICEQLTPDSARPPGFQSSRVRYPPKTLNKAAILGIRPGLQRAPPSRAPRKPPNKRLKQTG